jgi:hypothetical protein
MAVVRWPGLKVLLTSGFPQARLGAGFEAEGFKLLTKPYRKSELAERLREVLDAPAAQSVV